MRNGVVIANEHRTWLIGVQTAAGMVVALSVAILSDAMRAEIAPPVANQEVIPLDRVGRDQVNPQRD